MVIAYICPAVLASKYNQGAVVKYASLAHLYFLPCFQGKGRRHPLFKIYKSRKWRISPFSLSFFKKNCYNNFLTHWPVIQLIFCFQHENTGSMVIKIVFHYGINSSCVQGKIAYITLISELSSLCLNYINLE